MAPNTHHSLFPIHHFVCTYMHNSKLPIKQLLYNWRCLFSQPEQYARYDWQDMAPNTHHSPFPIRHFVRTYTHVTWKLQVLYGYFAYRTNGLLSETFRVWLWSCMRDPTGELWPQTCIGRSLIQHCVCILQAHTCIVIWCATTRDNKTHVVYDCTPNVHQMMALLPMILHFIRTKFASYTIHRSVFPITEDATDTCTLILISLIRGTTALLYKLSKYACHHGTLQQVCCQAAK